VDFKELLDVPLGDSKISKNQQLTSIIINSLLWDGLQETKLLKSIGFYLGLLGVSFPSDRMLKIKANCMALLEASFLR
jgi:hypothetical protein